MEFQTLVESVVDDGDLKSEIERLVAAKRAGAELDRGPRIDMISGFIEQELDRLEEGVADSAVATSHVDQLNRLFRAALDEVWEPHDR